MSEISFDQVGPLPGDELVAGARKQITRSVTIEAAPEAIWPWLVRMAQRDGDSGGSILRSEPPRVLLLGALYDRGAGRYLPFDAPRPTEYWQATWALVLSSIGARQTRLDVRSRVTFTGDALRWAAVWMHPFHDFMAPKQLHSLERAARN